jgi:hypothetical protein
METEQKKPFNKRAFISVALFITGLSLPVSGIMNHSLGFEPLTPARHFWMSAHNMSGVLFIICAVFHIVLNWRALLRHMKNARHVVISREALAAILLLLVVVGAFSSHAFHVR